MRCKRPSPHIELLTGAGVASSKVDPTVGTVHTTEDSGSTDL